ncbi:MAG: DUF4079 family protein [Nitrospirota bacterium]|nr:DUF4079 family protein [Nitrospirota bacterium]
MIDSYFLAYMKLAHGMFNAVIFVLIVYQGLLGYRLRKARLKGIKAVAAIRRHRRNGPVLALLGIAGFFAGAVLVYLDHGHLLKYPLHFINGASVSTALAGMFLISRKIRAADNRWRMAHYRLGIITIVLYVVQLFLGLDIFL